MGDPTELDLDMRALCERALRDYEEVIATIIRRPVPPAPTRSEAAIFSPDIAGAPSAEAA